MFFMWVGFGGDLAFGLLTADAAPGGYQHTIPFIGIITSLIAAGICWYSWRKGPERVLWATGAWEIIEAATPEQRQYVNVVEEMAIASGLPRPRIWIVPDDDPNAFATGRGPEDASVAVTDGLLRALDRDELQGVVAHEMAHIRNLDTRLHDAARGDGRRDRADVRRDGADDGARGPRVRRAGRQAGRRAGERGREPARADRPGALAAHAHRGADRLSACSRCR